ALLLAVAALLLAAAVAALLLAAAITALTLRLEAPGTDQIGLARHQAGQVATQPIDPALQHMVKHVGQHDHAALHPLAGAAELGMIELRHPAIAVDDGVQHARDGVRTETVPLGEIVDHLLAGGSEGAHGRYHY
ncbi:hypothetical protein RZS08_19915, partial [Arthrospira platensis SPKY1]|nr:hypothetical protein [Arthrospira platensis SPKY1]